MLQNMPASAIFLGEGPSRKIFEFFPRPL